MGGLFYTRRRYFTLAVLMIIALGIAAFTTIGRQEDPTITNIFSTIVTPYPGASPARVEALVTEKIEDHLREIPEIKEISSTSRTGISVVRVELSDSVAADDLEQIWSEVRDALSDASALFPQGVPAPVFDDNRTSAYTSISAIVSRDDRDVPVTILRRYAELLQDRLRALPGAKFVRTFGAPTEEILVEADNARLVSAGISINDVANAIRAGDSKVEAGQVRGARGDYLIEITGEIDSLERIRSIILASDARGALIRVGDVASVRRAVRTPVSTEAYADSSRAIVVATRMEPGLRVDGWMKNVQRILADFEAGLPDGVEHHLLFDQSEYTYDRLATLSVNLAIGVTLVVSVLFLTLGWRAALVVAAMLPLASLLSLGILQKLGVPIHQMSVTGLIVALGLLVDASIVMTDEIRRKLEVGMARLNAVNDAARRLAIPLAASTATTVFAFMPMALLPGPSGDFVGAIATAVIVMLISSFVLALTLTPALAGFLLPDDRGRSYWWSHGMQSGFLGRLFAKSLDIALANRGLAVLAALALPLIGFGAFPTLTAQFFPGVDRDQFYVQVRLPVGASIDETRRVSDEVDDVLRAEPAIKRVHWFIGESAPAFYYNMIADQDGVSSFAEALVTMKSAATAAAMSKRLQKAVNAAAPEAQVLVRNLVQGPPVDAPVEIRLVGPELAVLRDVGQRLRAVMSSVAEVTHTRATLVGGAPKVIVDLDERKVRLAGLSLVEVSRQINGLTEGVIGGSMIEGSEELPVRVRAQSTGRATTSAIASLEITSPSVNREADAWPGVPLSALGTISVRPSDSPIDRRNGERINTIQAYIQPGVLPEEALKKVLALLRNNPIDLPAGYRIETGGDSDARSETVGNLMASIGLIVTLMIATIVLTFNSYRLAVIAALVSVLSMGLSLLALAIFGYPFGIQALIGVIGSIGVSINAAIIIMTGLQQHPAANAGDRSAIRDVVMQSSRHIVSTTVTTFGGFLPLILEGGGFWPPFAMSIAGGVLLSTIVSFYFVPPMFSLFVGTRNREAVDPALHLKTA
jgi:multidrug efflux pump subunit AcrB